MARRVLPLSVVLALAATLIAAAPVFAQDKKPGTTTTSDTTGGEERDAGKGPGDTSGKDPSGTDAEPAPKDADAGRDDAGKETSGTDAGKSDTDPKDTHDGKGRDDAGKETTDDSAKIPVDCLDPKQATDGAIRNPACVDEEGNPIGIDVVVLPDILVDLFPVGSGNGGVTQDGGAGGSGIPTGQADNTASASGPASGAGGQAAQGGGSSGGPNAPAAAAARAPLTVPPQAVSGDFVPDEVLVTIDGAAADVADIAANFGLEVRSQRSSELLGVTIVRYGIPDGRPVGTVLAQLAAEPRALERVPNHVLVLQQAGAIVNYAFTRISLEPDKASGADVKVAVIDTGVDAKHPALAGVIAEEFDAMPDVSQEDRNHGTSVAGLIAGVGPFRGMAPGSTIYHARAFEGGKSTMDIILSALDWAASQDVRIVNMSFVGPENDLLESVCASARARGMVLVAAAGNNGPGAPYGYPAAYDGVIAVTATDADDKLMPQANRGPYVYVSAPGVDMLAPIDGGTDAVTGTSFAAAIVSGAVANLIHENPERSADWIEKALAETASDLGDKGRDEDFGFGLINTEAAAALK
jgi:subtilisin family serine protease